MKIFVTGGTGFIGSHFVKHALEAGHEVIALRRPGSCTAIPLSHEPTWVEGSLTDDWRKTLADCSALVHLAAAGVSMRNDDWRHLFLVNVQQSLDLWLQAVDAGVKRLVICGSCFEYGKSGERHEFIPSTAPLEPTGPYHASKAAATMAATALCIERRIELAVLRPFHVFGEGEGEERFWPSLRKAALAGEDFTMTPGEQVRDFIPVESVAEAFVAALRRIDLKTGEPRIENVGTGRPQSLRQFAGHWWRHWDARGRLLVGALPYRDNEVMRYVPRVPTADPGSICETVQNGLGSK